ncbi:MAG: FAD-binding oxidoreductase [Candidatus Nanoarchaeia archaeon]|nr:FAD-binding oxidoreductase [Candidatus Nanoarchaeia archaeon]
MTKVLLDPYLYDASQIKGEASKVFFPRTINEIKKIIQLNKHICIRAGGTGLVGGSVPQNEVILDLSKLNHISNLDLNRKTIEVEAGVILDDLQDYLSKNNLEFPVNPSSHGVCTIGGMIATDAVGSRAIKYGRTSKWVRWIETIDANGNLTRNSNTELSDFSRMEGITGVIVKACLNLTNQIKRTGSLFKIETIEEVIKKTKELKNNPSISMIEYLDKFTSNGLGFGSYYHLIAEFEDNGGELKNESYFKLLQKRDEVYPFLAGEGYTHIEDPKMILDKLLELMKWLEKNNIPCFGHISVGLLHPCFNKSQEKLIPEMMKIIKKHNGQISGEHGIGLLKKQYVDEQDKKIILNIKKRKDKQNKFNQGKIIH